MDDLDAHARALIEASLYMTLGTAGAEGRPWVSPRVLRDGRLRRVLLGVRPRRCPLAQHRAASAGEPGHVRLAGTGLPRPRGLPIGDSHRTRRSRPRSRHRDLPRSGDARGRTGDGRRRHRAVGLSPVSRHRDRGVRALPARTPATVSAALDQRRPPDACRPVAARPVAPAVVAALRPAAAAATYVFDAAEGRTLHERGRHGRCRRPGSTTNWNCTSYRSCSGRGRALFDNLPAEYIELELARRPEGRDVTHLRYRVRRLPTMKERRSLITSRALRAAQRGSYPWHS